MTLPGDKGQQINPNAPPPVVLTQEEFDRILIERGQKIDPTATAPTAADHAGEVPAPPVILTDAPHLVIPYPSPRGVWLQVRQDPRVGTVVDVSFAARSDVPDGPDWTWIDETMVGSQVDTTITEPASPPPPEPKIDTSRLVTDVEWDDATQSWRTAPDAGLAQLDVGDDPPNASVPLDSGPLTVDENDIPLCECGHSAFVHARHGEPTSSYRCTAPGCPCVDYQRATG